MNRPTSVIDWPQIIADMQHLLGDDLPGSVPERVPLGTRAMADDLNVSRDLVRNWLAGVVPKHPEGEQLIARWMSLTGKARVFLPMTRAVLSASKARA